MDLATAFILSQDGITSGAIYALLALCILLVFTVTRILLIPIGEFTVYGALTMASLESNEPSIVVWLLISLVVINFILDIYRYLKLKQSFSFVRHLAMLVYAIVIAAAVYLLPLSSMSILSKVLLTLTIITPIGPQIYSAFFQPLVSAPALVLLIVSIAVHVSMVGIALLIFGPNGAQTTAFSDKFYEWGILTINSQTLWILFAFVLLIALFSYFFSYSLYGKALRATAINRVGARLMGISPIFAGKITFALAAFIGALSGILIAPITTLYYDSGFLISLKGFVGAIIGGLVSFPVAALGSIIVGLVESFSMFLASDYKEIIVFTLIIPFLLWKSLTARKTEEEDE